MPYPEDLLAAEDNAAAQLEKEFLDSVKVTVKQIDWDKLEKDLADHAAGADIVDGLPWEEYDPEKVLKNLFEAGLEVHGEYIGSVKGGAIFDYVDPHALDWISQYGADEIKYISDSQKEAIKKIVLDGYQNGVTVRNQARQIREHIGLDPQRSETLRKYAENLFAKGKSEAEVWRLVEKRGKALLTSRANTIAVNEASEAAGRAAYESTKSAVMRGVIDPNLYEGFRIVTGDERTCKICMAVEGEARTLPDGTYPSSGSQIAKKHIKCLAPDTRISAPGGAVAITRSVYSGKMYRFTLSNGANITTTGNHLILTRHGFAAAHLLREGDDILNCPELQRGLSSNPNDDRYIPTIEETFNSISVDPGVFAVVMPSSSEDFHGDGGFIDSDIDIIRPNRLLGGTIKSSLSEPIEANCFDSRHFGGIGALFSSQRGFASMFERLANAADSIVGGLRQSSSFFLGRLGHSQEHGIASAPGHNSVLVQASSDDAPVISEMRCQRLDGHTGIIEPDEFTVVDNTEDMGLRFMESHFLESIGDDRRIAPEMLCNVTDTFSGLVTANEVIHIDIYDFHGYVYDVQSISTLLIGNSIIVSNCRCVEGIREKKGLIGDSIMQFDSIQIGGHVVEKTDLITVVTGRLMEEGVQNRGLKRWESFYDPEGLQGCMWFEGVPIVKYAHPTDDRGNHIKVDGSMELAGKVRIIMPDLNARAVFAEFRLFNSMFSDDEMKLIESGEFIGGSIGYDTGGREYFDEPKIWEPTGEEYDFEYLPPFYGDHFAIFVNPACVACGLNADSHNDGCKCSRKKEELKMTEKPPAQAGTEGAPAQAGSLGDEGKGKPAPVAVVQQQKTQGDQIDPEALKIKAQTVLAIQDDWVKGKEAVALLLEIVTGEPAPEPAMPAGMGDSKNPLTRIASLESRLDALASDNKRLTEAENARIQADAAAKDAADSASMKANFDQAYQMDWEAKHWPTIKKIGPLAFMADSENARHWVGPQAAQKIEPTGQRFVPHPGADEEGSEYDAGIDAELKKVR